MTLHESTELVNGDLSELRGYVQNLQEQEEDYTLVLKIASRKQLLAEAVRLQHNRLHGVRL
jgi:sulfur transfer protein SufE